MAIALVVSGPLQGFFLAIAGVTLLASFSVTVVFAQELLPHHLGLASGLTLGLAFGAGGVGVGLSGVVADAVGLRGQCLDSFGATGNCRCARVDALAERARGRAEKPMRLIALKDRRDHRRLVWGGGTGRAGR